MKKLIPLNFILYIIFYGCENYKPQFEQIRQERDSLIYVTDAKDSSINSFIASFNEIESNLDTIAYSQGAIEQNSDQTNELKADQKERINENIRIINEMLERNKLLIENLEKKVKSQGGRISELRKLVDNLKAQVSAKDTELVVLKFQIDDLKMNVDNLNVTIDTLTAQNLSKENLLKENIEKLNAAYYIIGTFKELRDKNIVNKEGGFLGIGKNQILKADFNSDAFTRVDITKLSNIELNCKKAIIITNHPSASYSFEKEKDKFKLLTINDYEKFWGASKYLVIVKD